MPIVCPRCHHTLFSGQNSLVCGGCRAAYAVREGIPDLYVDETTSDLSREVEQANIEHYNSNVQNFEKNVVRPSDEFYDYEKGTLKEFSGDGRGRILDIGTGTGKILQLAAPFYKELYGIDVSIEMLKTLLGITPFVFRSSVLCLPFRDEFFDVVTAHSVLHHIIDLKKAMGEVHRTLKPGGVFYSDTDASSAFVNRFGWFLQMRRKLKKKLFEGDERIERLSDYYHQPGMDPEAVRKTLYSVGFDEVEIRYHFPQNPDDFTKLIMELDSYHYDPSHYYYFVMVARKRR